ncbi:biotinidase [Osmerus eperlanus]|uniref:biotinidase n=1 Tax=Osmerus eperlanus TaxID=29151 RepID=UPI002E14BDD0
MSTRAPFAAVVAALGLCLILLVGAEDGSGRSYVAAVYEHLVNLNSEPHVPLSRAAALQHMKKNLDVYEMQAAVASRKGAQIIVFPEDGLHGFNFSRSSIAGYLETIPDPKKENWNPCTEPGRHAHTEVLQHLSCMARRHRLFLVANMADLQPCSVTSDLTCPPDGRWQFNTDVVFRLDGLLVARYHKYNLYFENAFDKPPSSELVTFDTPFAGTFGVLTCFDILFHNPTVTLLNTGVRQLVYPTAWMNQLPLLAAVQFQWAFSRGANISVLGANIRSDPLGMTGSGIFSPDTALYHHARAGELEAGKLLVGRLPVLDPAWLEDRGAMERGRLGDGGTEPPPESEALSGVGSTGGVGGVGPWPSSRTDSFCLPKEEDCQRTEPSSSPLPPNLFYSSMMYDQFAFKLLPDWQGDLTVCDGAFCCRLQYQRSPLEGSTELYALGAFAGTHVVNGRYALQVCALVRCSGTVQSSCGQDVEEAETKMDFLLEGNFSTPHVYPSVVVSQVVLERPDVVERSADGRVAMRHSGTTAGLVTACLYGRMYDQDGE